MSYFTALGFLTVIPWPTRAGANAEEVGRSAGFFPLVGATLGLILAGLDRLLRWVLPSSLANVVLLVTLALLTGLLHLDGFIDTCDALGGPGTPHERWQVMDDSRVGSYGVVGAVLLLLTKYVCLAELPISSRAGGLFLAPLLSRWALVWAICSFPSAKPAGLGRTFKERMTWASLLLATSATAAASLAVFQVTGIVMMCALWLVMMALATFLSHRFAGLSGDTYGAIVEVTETVALLMLCLLPVGGW